MPGFKGIAGCCCDECCQALPLEYRIRRAVADGWWQPGDTIAITITGCEGWEVDCDLEWLANGISGETYFASGPGCELFVGLTIDYVETDEDTDEFVFRIAEFIVCSDPDDTTTGCATSECMMVRNPETGCIEIVEGPAADEETECEPCCPEITLTPNEGVGGEGNWWCVEDEEGCRLCTFSEDGTEPAGAVAGPYDTPLECQNANCGRYYCVSGSCQFLNCPPEGQTFEDGWDTLEECQAADCEPPPPELCWYCVLIGEAYVCVSQPCTDPPPAGAQGGSHPTSTACDTICSKWGGAGCYCVNTGLIECCMYLSSPDDIPPAGEIVSGPHGAGPECDGCDFHCENCPPP